MSQTYNSQYYIDIFKYLLQRKLQKGPSSDSFLFPVSNLTPSLIFSPSSPPKRSHSSSKKYTVFDTFNPSIISQRANPLDLTASRKNKARLYNENLVSKVSLMKSKKNAEMKAKREAIEQRQTSRENKFKLLLEKSKRSLSEKILKISQKREDNLLRAMSNRFKLDQLLEEKLEELKR